MSYCSLAECHEGSLFGGKAVQLGEALRGGLPVPPGIALSVDFVEGLVAGDAAAVVAVANALVELGPPVAARSSARGEDSAEASFAGQHVTLLNLRSADALIAAIRTIRDSAHSAAARAYRQRLGIVGEPATGVVIQKLILADCAGVLFSRDPISNRDERVIEAAWGLGEAVVSGLVNPDRYRLSRDGALIERTAGEKDLMIRWLDESGTEEQSVEPALVHAFCLDEQKLSRLHELANRCEHVFGGPQDLEWAFADDQLFLLQRRAITGRHG